MSTETSGIEGRKVSAPADVLADLRSVVRIAKAASVGVTGNAPRIERAEKAIAAVAELIEAVAKIYGAYGNGGNGRCSPDCMSCRIQRALARAQGVVL